MYRYSFLTKSETYCAMNRLRDAFLAARDGTEVNELINGLLTEDEKIRIGRRIQIAESLINESTFKDIADLSKVGVSTIAWVARQLRSYPKCFELVLKRKDKTEKDYMAKKFRKVGGSQLVYKKNVYTGAKRSDAKR